MMNFIKNLGKGLLFFGICFLLQYAVADFSSSRWVHYRYFLFLSMLTPFIVGLVQQRRQFIMSGTALFLVLGLTVPLSYKLLKGAELNGEFVWDELIFALGAVLLLQLVQIVVERLLPQVPYISRAISSVLKWLAILPCFAIGGYSIISKGDVFDVNSINAIYQTNSKEAMEFISSTVSWPLAALLVVCLLVVLVVIYASNKKLLPEKCNLLKLAALLILVGVLFNKTYYNCYFVRICRESKEYIATIEKYNDFRMDKNGKLKPIEVRGNDKDADATYVVVIGESQNKRHMGVYGYNRNTTPWLQKAAVSKNFVLMENAYACHTLTMQALSKALTGANQYNGKDFSEAYSLIDMAKAAGFETYWISNQAQFGSFSTPVTAIANTADKKIWLNSDSNAGNIFDEEIIKQLPKVNKNGKKVVFIHLYGNHWEYKHRYPQQYKLNDDEISKLSAQVNEYDSSMVYNDYVVSELLDYAKDNWNLKSMVYFSDHGEAVYSGNKHIPGKLEKDMVTIPVYFYFSDKYLQENAAKVDKVRARGNVAFTNDMLFDTMLDIWGLQSPVYQEEYDVLSDEYKVKSDELKTIDMQKISELVIK